MLIRRPSAQVSRERTRQVTRLVLYLCDGFPTSLCGAVRGAIYLARLFGRENISSALKYLAYMVNCGFSALFSAFLCFFFSFLLLALWSCSLCKFLNVVVCLSQRKL